MCLQCGWNVLITLGTQCGQIVLRRNAEPLQTHFVNVFVGNKYWNYFFWKFVFGKSEALLHAYRVRPNIFHLLISVFEDFASVRFSSSNKEHQVQQIKFCNQHYLVSMSKASIIIVNHKFDRPFTYCIHGFSQLFCASLTFRMAIANTSYIYTLASKT